MKTSRRGIGTGEDARTHIGAGRDAAGGAEADFPKSAESAMLLLDRELRIKQCTPALARIIKVSPSDTGRPIGDLPLHFVGYDLAADARAVAGDGSVIEREARHADGSSYRVRVMPSRTPAGQADGVVVTVSEVTRLRWAEKQTRRLARVVTDSSDAILLLDRNGTIQTWNRGAEAMYGWNEAEASGMNILDLAPPDRASETADLMRRVLAGETIASFETRRCTKDGRVLDVWLTAAPVTDEAACVEAMATIERDITGRKQTEAALAESLRHLEVVVDGVADGFYVLDRAWRLTLINEAALRHLRKTRQEVLGHGLLDIFPALRGGAVEASIRRAFETGEPVRSEVPSAIAALMMEMRVHPTADGVVVLFRDITERSRLQAALRAGEERLRLVADSTYDWEYWRGADNRFLYVSPSCERVTGYSREEFMRDPTLYLRIVHPDDRVRVAHHLTEDLAHATAGKITFRIVRRDGRERWIDHACQPVTSADGSRLGRRASNRDITDRMQSEAMLARMKTLLEEGQKIAHVGSFEYVAATGETIWSDEEFRLYGLEPSPRSPTYADLVRKHVHPDDAARVERVFGETQRAGSLFELEHRVVHPDGTVRDLYNVARPYFDASGALVKYIGASLDITERRAAEKTLQRLNADLEQRIAEQTAEIRRKSAYNRTLIETSVDPLVTIGPDGTITDVNAATELATGRPRKELIGSDFSDYFTEPDRARAGYRKVFQDGFVRDYPLEIRRRDGQATPVLYNASVYRDEKGDVVGVFAAARDITDLKRTGEALKAERQRLYDVLETLPVYVVLLDREYHVPFANKFFRERFGESGGRRCHEYLFHRGEPCETCESYKAMHTGKPHHWEWHGPDGRDYDIYDFPFKDADGSLMVMEMGIDITEVKKARTALQQANETLEQRVNERTAELTATNRELARFNKAMVDRELRMIELKKEVNDVCRQAKQPERYTVREE